MPRFLLAIFLFLLPLLAWADDGFVIQSFDVQIQLQENATLEVQERITVQFLESRRGIFREIPIRAETSSGNFRSTTIKGIEVIGEQIKVTYPGNLVNIRIGNPDIYLSPGTVKTYDIRYLVRGAINWFDEDDDDKPDEAELYWNVTGNEWPTSIGKTSFRVDFPKVDSVESVRGNMFRGDLGSQNTNSVDGGQTRENGNVRLETLRHHLSRRNTSASSPPTKA